MGPAPSFSVQYPESVVLAMSEKLNSELFALIPRDDCSNASQDTSDLAIGEACSPLRDSRRGASGPVLYTKLAKTCLEPED